LLPIDLPTDWPTSVRRFTEGIVGSKPAKQIEFFAQMGAANTASSVSISDKPALNGTIDTLVPDPLLNNLFTGTLAPNLLPAAITDATHPPLTLYFDNTAMTDLWLAITWRA